MSDPFDLAEAFAAEPPPPAPYLDGLNPMQRQAVEAIDGPVLVLAGAGTGKTRALTARLVHILMTGRAMPSQVLAVTFTNRAALQMKSRVAPTSRKYRPCGRSSKRTARLPLPTHRLSTMALLPAW